MPATLLAIFLNLLVPQLSFMRYAEREGFPQQHIQGFAQDCSGHILIASTDVYTYDGFNITKSQDSLNVSFLRNLSGGRIAAVYGKTVEIISPEGIEKFQFDKEIKSVVSAANGRLWFVSSDRIYWYEGKDLKEKLIPGKEHVLCAELYLGMVFLGTDAGVMYVYDPLSGHIFAQHKFGAGINAFHNDGNGTLWVGTGGNGVYSWASPDGIISQHSSDLSSKNVLSLCTDRDGVLWVGSVNGLNLIEENRVVASLRNERDNDTSLSSNTITSIFRDSQGGMWLGTSSSGINYFYASALKTREKCPEPEITSICVSGSMLELSNECVLNYPDRNISICFSAPDYAACGTDVFEYCLEGLDKGWRRAGKEQKADYSYLPRGRYIFKLRVSRDGNTWTQTSEDLRVCVRPAWYASIAATILWLMLILLSVWSLHSRALKRKEEEHKLTVQSLEKKYTREINRLKVLRILNPTLPIVSADDSDNSFDRERFLTRAMNLVEMNLNRPEYSTDDLATGLALSRSSLHKYMKAATGDSALAFIHKIRFSRACELLEKNDLSIAEICNETGFSSPSYFSSSFKKFMGCSPQEYQKRRS